MRVTTRQTGIISYAGLEKEALLSRAKRAFAQADEEVPARFATFLPVFPMELVQNMSYVGLGGGARVSPAGFSLDAGEYHKKLYEEMPELYVGANHDRLFDVEGLYRGKGVVTVDAAWAERFSQYAPFLGEKLMIYMIGGGHQAVAVPESIYPRGGGILRGAEIDMRVTARCEHFTQYMRARMAAGDRYDPLRFEEDYLRLNQLLPVHIRQAELGRVMQDVSILKSIATEQSAGAFTESAKRAEPIAQYVPFQRACDAFEREPITRATARLMQLCREGEDFISDLWLPYQDASEYIDRRRMTLDVRALCEGFQIAPMYDPQTGGGRYPDRVRVVVVRDRDIHPMVAETLNNPAYGDGMGLAGAINRLVFLPDSAELLRQRKLGVEETDITCENMSVPSESYRRMLKRAALQEHKGQLVDAMHRRESALNQMQAGTPAYERARRRLTERVTDIEAILKRDAADARGQLSGYDADIDYLRRMALNREGVPEDEAEPIPFAPDALRERSIESGFAMRDGVRRFALPELFTDEPPEPESAESADDEPTLHAEQLTLFGEPKALELPKPKKPKKYKRK